MESAYIETSIASFYHETRRDAESLARKHWTRHWWTMRRQHFDCHTSVATIDELERGNHPMKANKLSVVAELNLLEINNDVREIAKVYISNYFMPVEIIGDALHVAIASYHKMDYLLTWNCSHLANANKKKHLRRLNERLRLNAPEIITMLFHGEPSIQPDRKLSNQMLLMPKRDTAILCQDIKVILEKIRSLPRAKNKT